jgi:hypothetical protein
MDDRELRLRRTIDRLRDDAEKWRSEFKREQAAHRATKKKLRLMQDATRLNRPDSLSEKEIFRAHGVSA